MSAGLPLAAALKRGALLTAANWPVVLVDFGIESLYKLGLGVPVVGGAVLVAVRLDVDLRALLSGGIGGAADLVIGSLAGAPVALAAFVAAVAIVAAGGAVVMFVVKAATLATLADADRRAGPVQRAPVRLDAVRATSAYTLPALLAHGQRFARRATVLALLLSAAYAGISAGYVLIVARGFSAAADSRWAVLWPLIVVAGAGAAVVAVWAVNLLHDLVRVAIVTEDCGIAAALGRVRRFVLEDPRHVLGIFAVMTVVHIAAGVAGFTLTAALASVAFVPFVGLAALPLQLTAWLARGVVVQSLTSMTLTAYLTQYRRVGAEAYDNEIF